MTQPISTPASQAILIQQLLESAGLAFLGQATLEEIRILPNNPTTDITLTVSCARNSDTVPTTEASPLPSPARPNSPSTSSKISSQSISEPFLRTSIGNDGLMINFEDLDFWLRSQGASDGSSEDVMIQQCCAKLSLMIHKVLWPT